MVLPLGLEPRLTSHLENRDYKSRRATLHYRSKLVPRRGLEPPCLSAVASKTTVYTIPPSGHIFGGSGRIRTYGPRKETLVFKTSAFNRSATDPNFKTGAG